MLAFRNDRFSPSGTDGSNPLSSSGESANHRSLQFADVLPPAGEDLLPAVCTGPDSEHATGEMKVGIIGVGAVGSACLTALVARGCAREIVVVNRERKRAQGLVTDVQYGAVLCPHTELRAGDYSDLEGAALVLITAGANEKTGGATDRNDPAGRRRLLDYLKARTLTDVDQSKIGDIIKKFGADDFEERVKQRPSFISFPAGLLIQGAVPIMHDDECVGAIGVSGVQSFEDEQIARAGVDALK